MFCVTSSFRGITDRSRDVAELSRACFPVASAEVLFDRVRHWSHFPNRSAQLVLRHAELLAPVPQFVILVDVDPLTVAVAANAGIVSHSYSFDPRDKVNVRGGGERRYRP